MKTRLKSVSTGVAVCALAAGGVLVGASSAQAIGALPPETGGLTITPATGTGDTAPGYLTNGRCPLEGPDSDGIIQPVTNFNVRLHGPGLPDDGAQLIGPTLTSTLPETGNYNVGGAAGTSLRLLDAAQSVNPAATTVPNGRYVVIFNCTEDFGTSVASFTSAINFAGNAYTAEAAPAAATTTNLTVAPAGPIGVGDSVTLSATVSPAAAGTVQFKDGAADVGAPQTIAAGGTATVSTTTLATGSRSLTAVFTSSDPAFGNSTSAPTTLVVNAGPAQTTTTTSITVSPAGPVNSGDSVTLSATVSPAAAGSIQFKDGAADVGAPQTIAAGGTATVSTTTLAPGSRSLTAVFTSSDPAFGNSTSAATTLVVNAGPAQATTTTLSGPSTVVAGAPFTVTATVDPAAAGTIQFLNGAIALGAPVPVVAGTASRSVAIATAGGPFPLTAQFIPADPAAFAGSTSAPVAITVTARTNPVSDPDVQTITGTVAAGTITITTPYTPTAPLNVGTLLLNPAGTLLSANAPFEDIVITDTRAGDPGWTASAQSSDLASGTNLIDAQNVGLTSLVPTYTAGNNLQTGDVTTVDNAAAPGVAAGTPGTLGLAGVPHTIATTVPGQGLGTVELNGVLTLNAPTSTVAGVYTGTVTFTAG